MLGFLKSIETENEMKIPTFIILQLAIQINENISQCMIILQLDHRSCQLAHSQLDWGALPVWQRDWLSALSPNAYMPMHRRESQPRLHQL